MKQQLLNAEYVIPYHSVQPYENNYGNLYGFHQNYQQNYVFFPQNQLSSFYFPTQYTAPNQYYLTAGTTPPIIQAPELPQAGLINDLNHDSIPQPSFPTINSQQVIEQVSPERDAEENKKIQRRLNRIKHITQVNKNRALRSRRKSLTSYYWNSDENKRYLDFLRNNPGIFDLPVSEKKNMRVNVMMSKKIKTRTAQQCHSHHQKMIKKYGTTQNILRGMEIQEGQILGVGKTERDQVKDQVKAQDIVIDS